MNYIGSSVSQSPTISAIAAAITAGAGLAVKYDADGKVTLCDTAGEAMLGLLALQSAQAADGESVTVQISGQGMAAAGGTFQAGDLLAVDSGGRLVKAAEGSYIAAQALQGASAGGLAAVQIIKGGKA